MKLSKQQKQQAGPYLNLLFSLGAKSRKALRSAVCDLLTEGNDNHNKVAGCLVKASETMLHVPFQIDNYTDFYAGIHHMLFMSEPFSVRKIL